MFLSLILATVLAPSGSATPAAPVEAPAAAAPPAVSTWYGNAAIACDLLSFPVTLAGGVITESLGGAVPGLGLFALGAPVNHGLHHEPGRVVVSLGLRILALAGAYSAASAISNGRCGGEHPPDNCSELFALALLGPPIAVMIVDDIFLARTTAPAQTALAKPTFAPGVALGPNSASLSLGGTF